MPTRSPVRRPWGSSAWRRSWPTRRWSWWATGTTAVAPATQRTNHTGAFQSTTILRLAFAETSAIVGALLAFVVPAGGMVLYLLGAAVTLAAMALHVYPSDATIDRVRRSLEREGGKSYLREDLDVGTHRPHEGL